MEDALSVATAAVTLVGGLYAAGKWVRAKLSKAPAVDHSGSIATRFIQLFEAHGVHRNQIPAFFGHDLQLADMQSDEALLQKLSRPLLKAAVSLFQVNAEWLDHGKGEVFPQHDFYKRPASFGRFIDQLREHNPGKEITGYVLTEKPPYAHKYDTLILLKEEIGVVGERTIYRYHFCPDWIMRYWKCRVDLTCCIAQAQMRDVRLIGKYVNVECIRALAQENQLPAYDLESGSLALPFEGHWSVGEYVDVPETFVHELDGEDGFAIEAAIGRWLEYYDEGLLFKSADADTQAVRATFEKYLATRTHVPMIQDS